MFETIVWATDGLELADRALPLVEELARAHDSRIIVVHAAEVYRGGRFSGGLVFADDDELGKKIVRQVDELRASGFDADLDVRTGDSVAHMIAAAAEEHHADLIVVGTHGRGALATVVAGSVANELLHVAPCPVLALPPRVEAEVSA